MSFGPRFCHALTLSGVGLLMWYGLGFPSVYGPATLVVTGLITALVLSKPAFELGKGPRGALARLTGSFGWVPLLIGATLMPMLWSYHASIGELNRNGTLGLMITCCALVTLILHGCHLGRGLRVFQRISTVLTLCGFAGIAGALMAGQVQFSIVTLVGLALLQSFNRFVFLWPIGGLPGILFTFLIPLAMLLGLRIGHGLALPLICSFLIGFALSLPATRAGSPPRPERSQ